MPENFELCPEVDERWNGQGQIDLKWLEEHVKTCPRCQHIMRLVNQQVIPDILEEIGDEKKPRSSN